MPKKRLTKEEWAAKEATRRQRAAERNLQRWQSRQAHRNYLRFHSSRRPELAHAHTPIRNREAMAIPDADGDVFWSEMRPDKRVLEDAPIHLALTVSAGVSPEEVVRHLIKVAGLVASPLIQSSLQGDPFAEPQMVGYGPNPDAGDAPEPWERAHAERPHAPEPSPESRQEALILTLAHAVGDERAVGILLRALAGPPGNEAE